MININVWNSDAYSKIRNNDSIKNRVLFVTLGGSHAYGTNTETSDIDVRGVALNTKSSLIGLHPFEQAICNETDTTIYSFNKFIKLLTNVNPNVIEMLGCKEDTYLIPEEDKNGSIKKIFNLLMENKKLFLSSQAAYGFGGYATQQLRRLENAICHDAYDSETREQHIMNTLNSNIHHLSTTYEGMTEDSISFKINNNKELVTTFSLTDYPVRNFNSILNEITNIVRDYDKLNGRNNKKDEAHLNKHAMHLVRLYLMCFDILEKEEINTYREHDKDFLMEIRNGKYMNSDGTYQPEFFEMINEYDKRLKYDKENTSLPKTPNMKKINELTEEVNYITLTEF